MKRDTVTVDTPHGSCVAIVGAQSLAVDGVPRIDYLKQKACYLVSPQQPYDNTLTSRTDEPTVHTNTDGEGSSPPAAAEITRIATQKTALTVSLATENSKSPSRLYLI